jgi:hypothetical protein
MSTYQRIAELSLEIEDYELDGLQFAMPGTDFERLTTVIRLRGGGAEGVGEDVTYDAVDHDVLQAAGAVLALAGDRTLGEFCDHLEGLELWPEPPQREPTRQ